MTKEEIQHKITQAEKDISAIQQNITGLKTELAELEKLKLGHGDFGIDERDGTPLLVVKQQNNIFPVTAFDEKASPCGIVVDGEHRTRAMLKLGNIFDLMKDWDKDLDRTNIDGFVLEILSDRIVIGGRRFLIDSAEEFWQKLGQMIATLKRKNSQNPQKTS